MMEFNPDLDNARLALRKAPFEPVSVEPYTEGGGSLALKVKNKCGTEYAVRFPRNEAILQKMLHEKKNLDFINSEKLAETGGVAIPSLLSYVDNPGLPFLWHKAIQGDVLYGFHDTDGVDYNQLTNWQRQILAQDLAGFINAMHSIPLEKAKGIIPVYFIAESKGDVLKYFKFDEIGQLQEILDGKIPGGSFARIEKSVGDLNYSDAVCHFDLHGRNMAIDKAKKKVLNGVFDFGDASVNKRVADFYKLSFVHRDLTRRVVSEYNKISSEIINIADVDFIYLAAMGRFLKQSPNDGIVNNSLANFSKDYNAEFIRTCFSIIPQRHYRM
ncbi:MAG: aminoglycoside phosphotransferase family protein [Rickettsiales bacterium]|jgi:aminoglycoside phosphotransferase (APT) family kinase protein|nr:aminoglycoside phosphotransferase family protein [Rickettsiales bacterium]